MTKIIKVNLLILITLLSACSSTRLIYNLANNYIQNEISFFFDLNKKENVVIAQQVSELVEWHRKSMLPRYADYLDNLANKLEKGEYNHTDITQIVSNGQFLIEETVIGLTPYISKFLVQFQTMEDIEFMKQRIKIRRQERIKKFLKSDNKLYEERLKKLTSNFNKFFGTLSNEQMILLEKYARDTLHDSRIRLQNRSLRQKVFVNFLKTKPTQAQLTIYLNRLLLNGHEIINPDYKAFTELFLDRFRELLTSMLANSSKSQQETIILKLKDYAKDFKKLSG